MKEALCSALEALPPLILKITLDASTTLFFLLTFSFIFTLFKNEGKDHMGGKNLNLDSLF